MDLRLLIGRLAPTPSGALHLGNGLAFCAAWLSARHSGGRVLLRIEDVDGQRARFDVEATIRDDLRWLGLDWDEETPRQSERDYTPWLAPLRGLTYHCTCTRRDLAAFGGVYPGHCRDAGHSEGALRLRLPAGPAPVRDRRLGLTPVDLARLGDPILRRRDGAFAYPLAVVVDDLVDGVTEVVRGADLLEHSASQAVLWHAFHATPPTWLHTPLVLAADHRKLSKSERALHLGAFRAAGWRPADVIGLFLAWLGLEGCTNLAQAAAAFHPPRIPPGNIRLQLPPDGSCPPPGRGLHWERTDLGAHP